MTTQKRFFNQVKCEDIRHLQKTKKMMKKYIDVNDEIVVRFQVIVDACNITFNLFEKAKIDKQVLLRNIDAFASTFVQKTQQTNDIRNEFQKNLNKMMMNIIYSNANDKIYTNRKIFLNTLTINDD